MKVDNKKQILAIEKIKEMLYEDKAKIILGHEDFIITRQHKIYEISTGILQEHKKIKNKNGTEEKYIIFKYSNRLFLAKVRSIYNIHFGNLSKKEIKQIYSLPYLYHIDNKKQLDIRNYNIVSLYKLKTVDFEEGEKLAHHKANYYATDRNKYLRRTGLFTFKEIKSVKNKYYDVVNPSINGNQQAFQKSHVVYDSFNPCREKEYGIINSEGDKGLRNELDHIDRNIKNNSLNNIQPVTRYENIELIKLRNKRDCGEQIPQFWNDLKVY